MSVVELNTGWSLLPGGASSILSRIALRLGRMLAYIMSRVKTGAAGAVGASATRFSVMVSLVVPMVMLRAISSPLMVPWALTLEV
jgi:hypothetical protein